MTLGVEPRETEILKIHKHFGFIEFIKSAKKPTPTERPSTLTTTELNCDAVQYLSVLDLLPQFLPHIGF